MTAMHDLELYRRGNETLLGSWQEYARGATGASLERSPGVASALFPTGPERRVYNNALLDRGLGSAERADALVRMEAAYADAGIDRFAAWVHESDNAMRLELERRAYVFDTCTRAMGMVLDDIPLPRPDIEVQQPEWADYLRTFDLPAGLLSGHPHPCLRVLVARLDGEDAATAMAFDFGGDCGIYNVGTLEHARRRGLGTALTALHLHDARARGCRTASVQSTHMAEGVYAAAGFRDLGRFLEYVPGRTAEPPDRLPIKTPWPAPTARGERR